MTAEGFTSKGRLPSSNVPVVPVSSCENTGAIDKCYFKLIIRPLNWICYEAVPQCLTYVLPQCLTYVHYITKFQTAPDNISGQHGKLWPSCLLHYMTWEKKHDLYSMFRVSSLQNLWTVQILCSVVSAWKHFLGYLFNMLQLWFVG